jgi:hypothetical protein
MRKALLGLGLSAFLVLVGCGGGGGGGGGSSDSSSASRGSATVNLSAASLAFVGVNNNGVLTTQSQTLNGTLNNGSGTYYGLVITGQDYLSGTFTPTGDTSAKLSFTLLANAPIGISRGEITLELCSDSVCSDIVWAKVVPWTAIVYGLSASSVALSGVNSSLPQSASITIDPQPPVGFFAPSSSVDWVSASINANKLDLTVYPLSAPTNFSDPTVNLNSAAGSLSVVVDYTGPAVAGNSLGTLSATVGENSTEASLAQQVPVAFGGPQSASWSAVSNQSWLIVQTPTGAPGADLKFTLDPSILSAMPNGSTASGTITLTSGSLAPTTYTVNATIALAQIYMVTSGAILANNATTISISGKGFSNVTGGATFLVNGQAPTSVSIGSDTEAQLTIPALPAGNYPVAVESAGGVTGSSIPLVVQSGTSFAYAVIPLTESPSGSLWDPSRTALFTFDGQGGGGVHRLAYASGNWTVTSESTLVPIEWALTPDNATLYAGDRTHTLYPINPDTLAVGSSLGQEFAYGYSDGLMPITSNNRLWFSFGDWSLLSDVTPGTLGPLPNLTSYGSFRSSPDGAMILAPSTGITPVQPTQLYQTASDAITTLAGAPLYTNSWTFSSDHSRYWGDPTVYDSSQASFPALGSIPTTEGASSLGPSIMSADGSRIYTVAWHIDASFNYVVDYISVYDATSGSGAASTLTKLGQIATPDQPSPSCNLNGGTCRGTSLLGIDRFGAGLFLIGSDNVIVLPITGSLKQLAVRAPNALFAPAHRETRTSR